MEHTKEIGRPLVLVVDDNPDGRAICREFLRLEGYEVETASDGQEGLDRAFELLPDLILMDLSLPRLDGLEVTRRLSADGRTRDIPVIALTAHALTITRDEALEAGCAEVITKPCPPPELLARVSEYLPAGSPVEEETE